MHAPLSYSVSGMGLGMQPVFFDLDNKLINMTPASRKGSKVLTIKYYYKKKRLKSFVTKFKLNSARNVSILTIHALLT